MDYIYEEPTQDDIAHIENYDRTLYRTLDEEHPLTLLAAEALTKHMRARKQKLAD